jgi:very-short-patch-repair endonuclease
VAAPGTLPALEAQMRNHKSITSKAAARLELFARQHRCCLTESEARLLVCAKRASARRVVSSPSAVVGQFIADFCAPRISLIAGLPPPSSARPQRPHRRSGWRHSCAQARRDLKLRRAGFRIVRVSAELVLRDLGATVAIIRAAL